MAYPPRLLLPPFVNVESSSSVILKHMRYSSPLLTTQVIPGVAEESFCGTRARWLSPSAIAYNVVCPPAAWNPPSVFSYLPHLIALCLIVRTGSSDSKHLELDRFPPVVRMAYHKGSREGGLTVAASSHGQPAPSFNNASVAFQTLSSRVEPLFPSWVCEAIHFDLV